MPVEVTPGTGLGIWVGFVPEVEGGQDGFAEPGTGSALWFGYSPTFPSLQYLEVADASVPALTINDRSV